MKDSPRDIVEAIHVAFRGVQHGVITIHEAEVIDSYGTAKARVAGRRLDTETCWEEIPDGHIEECHTALCYLDPRGWRYYLPRYMEWTLRHYRRSTSMTVDHTIYALLLDTSPSIAADLRARYETLTPEQSRAVYRFLKLMSQNDDDVDAVAASNAQRKYWKKFSP